MKIENHIYSHGRHYFRNALTKELDKLLAIDSNESSYLDKLSESMVKVAEFGKANKLRTCTINGVGYFVECL